MTIDIKIENNAQMATVKVSADGKTESKKVPLNILFEVFQSMVSAQKDTGYLTPNLLREVVKNTVCRAYYFKEFVTDFKYTTGRERIRRGNKYGITYNEDGNLVVIPNFKFTNIVGFISNSNTDAFNPSFYQIYSVTTNLFGSVDDNSKLVRFFPNQFDDHICWPNTFNKDILKNRDLKIQSTFVTQYLDSKFNTDLFRHQLDRSKLRPWEEELDEFFNEVTGSDSDDFRGRDEVLWFYLTYFFLVTIKNIEPATMASDHGTIKQLFDRRA